MKVIFLFVATIVSWTFVADLCMAKSLSQSDLEAIKKEVDKMEKIIPIVQEEQRLEQMIGNLQEDGAAEVRRKKKLT